ncbi:hypothetical protein MHYP_G00361890 [Metynnis hypsauchen]
MADESASVEKRQVKPTAKAMEDALQRQTSARRAKLSQLTGKKNEMLELMEDDGNVDVIKNKLHTEFNQLFEDFCNINTVVKGLLCQILSEDEMKNEQQSWFEPKATTFREFIKEVSAWFVAVAERREASNTFNDGVSPEDSVSAISSRRSKKSRESSGSSRVSSVASSARLKTELEKAALLAKAAALKQRHVLDEQELKVKAEKEQLELQAALAAADAQLKVLQKYEESSDAGRDAGEHTLEQCKKLQKSLHREKLDFLRSKGLCFSCLERGHMSKACGEKLRCQLCSMMHPTLLHMKTKEKAVPTSEQASDTENPAVISSFVAIANKYSCSGAGNTDSVLAIVPVQLTTPSLNLALNITIQRNWKRGVVRFEKKNHNKEIEELRQENGNLKSEIKKLRTQLQDRQNELHNFKERMGKVVDLKLGSSGVLSEDLTNPCRESELKHMYEKLSKNQWAKVLRQLKTGGPEMTKEKINEIRKKAEGVIQDVLRQSQHDIQKTTGTMLCFTPSSQDPSHNSKTTRYFDLAIQNLQMAIYQEKKELYNRDKLQDVPEALYPMIDDCYKTGCLMALHNPPLLLDWDSCGQGLFPPIKTVASRSGSL